jgi:hypothetical protein
MISLAFPDRTPAAFYSGEALNVGFFSEPDALVLYRKKSVAKMVPDNDGFSHSPSVIVSSGSSYG